MGHSLCRHVLPVHARTACAFLFCLCTHVLPVHTHTACACLYLSLPFPPVCALVGRQAGRPASTHATCNRELISTMRPGEEQAQSEESCQQAEGISRPVFVSPFCTFLSSFSFCSLVFQLPVPAPGKDEWERRCRKKGKCLWDSVLVVLGVVRRCINKGLVVLRVLSRCINTGLVDPGPRHVFARASQPAPVLGRSTAHGHRAGRNHRTPRGSPGEPAARDPAALPSYHTIRR